MGAGSAWFSTSTVVATVIATSANYLLKLLDERRARRRKGTIEALRIAVSLERYAAECADIVANQEAWKQDAPFARPPTAQIPAAPKLPEVDWQTLSVTISSRIIALENEVFLVTASLSELALIDADAAAERARWFAGKYGLRSLEAAERLRIDFALSPLDLTSVEWDFREQLRAEPDA
jgi:hypothetical protein